MRDKIRTAGTMVLLAAAAGVAGDYLLRVRPGLNVLLWLGLVLVFVIAVIRREKVVLVGEGRWLAAPVLLLAAAFAWRNSRLLLLVDFLVIVFTVALAVLGSRAGRLRLKGTADYLLVAAAGAVQILSGPLFLLFADMSWQEVPDRGWSKTALAVLRGLLIAVPLLFIFGLLFTSADAVFQRVVTGFFSFDLGEVFNHVLLAAWFAWLAGGIMRSVLWSTEPNLSSLETLAARVSLGPVEAATVLGSLSALFAGFVAVQFRYLFGGAALVEGATGLTYAEYARRGFFELVAVAVLLLPLLLVVHWLLRHEDSRSQRLFRWLGGGLVGLLFIIMGSAFYRLWLYQQEFGQTELRFYVTAFMLWLGVVFVWFVVTVLRAHSERFMFGVLVTGYAALLLLHVLNPDAYITRANLAHFEQTGNYDAYYNVTLSADAVPVLVEAVPKLPEEEGSYLAQWLLPSWSPPEAPDWRSWNWGRIRAWRAVERHRELLENTP